MPLTDVVFFGILIVTIGISYYGFTHEVFFRRYMFNVKAVQGGDYIRLLSAGFLHAGWEHLIFNMISLFFFHKVILVGMGVDVFMLIYIGAIVFENLCNYGKHLIELQ